jgi:hypothetical protein
MVLATGDRHLNKRQHRILHQQIMSVIRFVALYVIVEAHDKHGGGVSEKGGVEASKMIDDVYCCRERVRFVHERNACNCLEGAYNELKRTTRRTNNCYYCREDKPANQIKVCSECNAVLYCSRKCQLAHYPEHMEDCKWIQDTMSTAECVD